MRTKEGVRPLSARPTTCPGRTISPYVYTVHSIFIPINRNPSADFVRRHMLYFIKADLRKRVRQAKNAINRTTIVASWAFRRSGGSGRNSIRVCLKIRRNQMIFYIQYGFRSIRHRTHTSSLPLIYYVAPQYKQVSGSLVCFALL